MLAHTPQHLVQNPNRQAKLELSEDSQRLLEKMTLEEQEIYKNF